MLITLTTDFGYRDPFVGIMKGVILGINPDVSIVDITHDINPHDIREAAFTINEAYRYFPPHSIHLVVVDPGVGSERRPILVSANKRLLIGPDNGVFSMIYDSLRAEDLEVTEISAEHYFSKSLGSTFHGRDIFAPVAAWLSRGIRTTNFGNPIRNFKKFKVPKPVETKDTVEGEVVHIDRFGNAITNIRAENIATLECEGRKVTIKNQTMDIKDYYAQGRDGKPHAIVNASGFLEIFIYRGNASSGLEIKTGTPVSATS